MFKKKAPPDIKKPEIEIEETKEEEQKIPLEITVERLKAQVEALNEFRKIVLERMNTMSEQLGELRSIIVSKERDIREIEAKATKAYDMVIEVQPEKFRIDLQKEATKREAILGELKSIQERLSFFENQLKDVRAKLKVFRGVEEIVEMNKEIKKELTEMKKMQSVIGAHADKVEDIYLNVEKRFSDFERYKQMLSGFEDRINDLDKDMKELKTKLPKLIEKDEFNKMRNEINEKFVEIDKLVKALEEYKNFLTRIDIQKRLYEIEEELIKLKRNITSTGQYLEDFTSVIEKIKNKLNECEAHEKETDVKIQRLLNVLEVVVQKVVRK